jgi:predicted cupin superfamily sugar epimerase
MTARVSELVAGLDLVPHPEGGFYREIFRSAIEVNPADGRATRRALTTIYFLLPEGVRSRWHRVASDEVWHLYEGGPLELLTAPPGLERVDRVVIGQALASRGPAHAVPAGWWQAARSVHGHALAGCTVGPGFSFEDFTFLADDPVATGRLHGLGSEAAAFL